MDSLHARVQALARQVDRLRQRADDLESTWEPPSPSQSLPSRRWLVPPPPGVRSVETSRKTGSGSAEICVSAGERRRARLDALRMGETTSSTTQTPRRTQRTPLDASEALQQLRQRAADIHPSARRTPIIVLDDTPTPPPTGERITIGSIQGYASSVPLFDPAAVDVQGASGWRRSREVGRSQVPGGDGMTSRGRMVAERTRERVEPNAEDPAPGDGHRSEETQRRRSNRPPRVAGWEPRFPPADDPSRPRLADIIRAHRLEVEMEEFPTPAEAVRSGLMNRVRAIADSASVSETPEEGVDSVPETFGDAAMVELRLLQNTVTRLNDRLEVARSNMAMLAAARSSLREHEENVERMAAMTTTRMRGAGEPPRTTETTPVNQTQTLARRPSFPAPRTPTHPHHRPRLGANPMALVINMDNMNSFDVNFDGNIIYRPISAREPDRELIARCLSMLPGGRDGTPSRWMRLTGGVHGRPRRAGTSAGFWVRWVCQDAQRTGLRHRSMDMTALPRITAFDFSVNPPDDDAFVRADEIEFYTARTRLESTVGPWMHSRVRVEPFEYDPPVAPWGTSAHVRQAVQQLGGLAAGHYMRYHLLERRTEARNNNGSVALSSSPRGSLERVLDSYESLGMDPTSDAVPADNAIGETSDRDTAWLMSYEPAIGQIRASWRAHYRRTREEDPVTAGAAVFTESAYAQTRREGAASGPSNELWSRDYLDENGVPLPALPVDQVVQSIRQESTRDSGSPIPVGTVEPDSLRITYV